MIAFPNECVHSFATNKEPATSALDRAEMPLESEVIHLPIGQAGRNRGIAQPERLRLLLCYLCAWHRDPLAANCFWGTSAIALSHASDL